MSGKTQMMKGILEGCVLKLLSKEKLYSQEICEKFSEFGFNEISRGTILPLLLRMENEELITYEKMPVPNGPARKYYFTTEKVFRSSKISAKTGTNFTFPSAKL